MAPRKKGVTKTPQKVKQWIYEEALEKHSTPSELLAIRVRKSLVDEGLIAEDGSPDKDTIINYIQEARRNDPGDEPWSLGALVSANIPPEANDVLLKLWRVGFVVDIPFTIREAQWAARLRGLVPLNELWVAARDYAVRERAWIAFGKNPAIDPIDTADLDAEISFRNNGQNEWGYEAAVVTGLVSPEKIRLDKEKLLNATLDDWDDESWLIADMDVEPLEYPAGTPISGPGSMLLSLLGRGTNPTLRDSLVKSIINTKLNEDREEAYAIWLRKLAKGLKWVKLNADERAELGLALLKEIEDAPPLYGFIEGVVGKRRQAWLPSADLLNRVGYTENDFPGKRMVYGWYLNPTYPAKPKRQRVGSLQKNY